MSCFLGALGPKRGSLIRKGGGGGFTYLKGLTVNTLSQTCSFGPPVARFYAACEKSADHGIFTVTGSPGGIQGVQASQGTSGWTWETWHAWLVVCKNCDGLAKPRHNTY